ncbi:MAG: flagellar basal body-associated protein FliL [Cycloclasticus sp.]|nr:flagellar basal body-associated protein FliL [Cycloclasticus sp.]MBG95540.1 flagellar basal body-associated protein FliL [Cycloclasticus sp.]|tara:strand:+ start:212 stop:745 length:534 start_codon:yes stop_codon:yes gene_type:complete
MAEQEEDVASEEKAGSKKKLLIIVGGAVLLLIMTFAGLYFSGFFDEEKISETAELSESDSTESAEQAGESEAGETIYHDMTPPFMVNFSEGRIKILKIAISVMAKGDEVIDAVKKHDPLIRNNILMMLSAQNPEMLKTTDSKEALQASIKEEINKVLAERKVSSKVEDVFFTDLVMQ